MLAERRRNCQPPHSLHETTQHRYCRCRPLVVTFFCYEFGTLSCAARLAKVPHFCTNYCRDWNCSPVFSPCDIWTLIGWHLSFWGCKRHQAARPDSGITVQRHEERKWTNNSGLQRQFFFFYLQKGTKENNTQPLRKNYNSNKNHMGAASLRSTWCLRSTPSTLQA